MLRSETVRCLGERQPAALLDRLDAERAVGISAGQNDACAELALIRCQRAEKNIDRFALASARLLFPYPQATLFDAKQRVAGQDIYSVLFNGQAVCNHFHRQARVTANDFMQQAFPVWTQMGDNDEPETRRLRHAVKKPVERLDAAR
jgi:hypothetical protein